MFHYIDIQGFHKVFNAFFAKKTSGCPKKKPVLQSCLLNNNFFGGNTYYVFK